MALQRLDLRYWPTMFVQKIVAKSWKEYGEGIAKLREALDYMQRDYSIDVVRRDHVPGPAGMTLKVSVEVRVLPLGNETQKDTDMIVKLALMFLD